jgi:peptide-methionine (R)-S-oxide reductase
VVKQYTDEELRKKLTPEQYRMLREKGTEAPFTGKYFNHNEKGMYICAVCGAELFSSKTKFESNAPGLQGWPSFSEVAKSDAVKLIEDNCFGMQRVEVECANCGSHLGHLFKDVPGDPHENHYCINSTCLAFLPEDKKTQKK